MNPVNIILIIIALFFLSLTFGNEYEEEEKMYMLVSPDQHTKTPRLEDFFWTGSGDGPPPPDLSSPVPSPSTPIVKTTTVVATVYLDSYPPQAVTDQSSGECVLNCDVTPDSLEPEITEDRRYWLLTVIQGSTPDSLQLRLARLYQKAFLRQQERHLGIIKSLDAPTQRKKHEVHSFVVNKDNNYDQIKPETPHQNDLQSSMISLDGNTFSFNDTFHSNIKEMNTTDTSNDIEIISNDLIKSLEMIQPTQVSKQSWILVTPAVEVQKRSIEDLEDVKEDVIDLPLESEVDSNNGSVLYKREIIKPEQQPPVQVHIQNITESTEGRVQIVYVVLVGGRAVPAAVAARDMRLVRDAEVATELGAVVTTKAERSKQSDGLLMQHRHEQHEKCCSCVDTLKNLFEKLKGLQCVNTQQEQYLHKKSIKSAASLRAYRNEIIRELERQNQMKQINDDKDTKSVSVLSPGHTRPSSERLPEYCAGAGDSSSSSSGVSEVAAALRKRHKPHALRKPNKNKTRVGTTDSLLEAAGLDSSDSGRPSPTSFLSMPSINTFPRGNMVEPLSRILEPVSVRHLDEESPREKERERARALLSERDGDRVVRRQMSSQLVRGGSAARDPGVVGPRVWDLHCQRIRDVPPSPASAPRSSRMRQRFNELMDDAFTLFGSGSSHDTVRDRYAEAEANMAQARNHEVRVRGHSAQHHARSEPPQCASGPRTARAAPPLAAPAWPAPSVSQPPKVHPELVTSCGRLQPPDPALPLISAIKTEIQRVRDNAKQ